MEVPDVPIRSPRRSSSAGRRLAILLKRERALWDEGFRRIAGVDEAGVGPLAGPVVAAAVVFPPGVGLKGVDDSKKVAPERREELAVEIRATALAWSVARADVEEIDRVNIYRATLEAMRRALDGLTVAAEYVLVDARRIPGLRIPQEPIVKGDARCHAIAAASILAKTARDALMRGYEERFPGYGFGTHKGYGTDAHREAIRRLGPCDIHRRSFSLYAQAELWEWAPEALAPEP
jgi:ribonuclease HII